MAGVSLLCMFKFALQGNHGSRIFMGRLYAKLDNCLSSRIQYESKKKLSSLLYMLQFCLKLLSQCLSLNMYLCYWMEVYRLRCMKMWSMALLVRWVTSVVHFKIMKNVFSESTLFNSSWLVRTPMQTTLMIFEVWILKC